MKYYLGINVGLPMVIGWASPFQLNSWMPFIVFAQLQVFKLLRAREAGRWARAYRITVWLNILGLLFTGMFSYLRAVIVILGFLL